MHSNNFVAAVKCNGQILREVSGREVQLPFDSQYSLLLKNKNNRRAFVDIKIDSEVVFSGLIIQAHDEVELERFQDKVKKLKFVRLENEAVSDKANPEKGLIQVDFWLEEEPAKEVIREIIREKEYVPFPYWHHYPWYEFPQPRLQRWHYGDYFVGGDLFDSETKTLSFQNTTGGSNDNSGVHVSNAILSNSVHAAKLSESSVASLNSDEGKAGATIEGEISNQKFVNTYFRGKDLSSYTQIRLWLRATDKLITVSETKNIHCSTCGSKCKFNDSFCWKCGSELTKETA